MCQKLPNLPSELLSNLAEHLRERSCAHSTACRTQEVLRRSGLFFRATGQQNRRRLL
jgi:hypothetical protein